MFETVAPVTGSWENIVAAIRSMVTAGLCGVGFADHGNGERPVVIRLGDDSEVRAYYARCEIERAKYRAIGDFRSADRVLCDYQVRGGSVGERPYTLSTNIYGWCMGSHLLSNLGAGKFAITDRGATLEECIVEGCRLARRKGTTLTFYAFDLVRNGGVSISQVVDLVRDAGGSAEHIDWVLTAPARQRVKDEAEAARRAQSEAERPAREAALAECRKIVDAVRAPFLADRSCRVEHAPLGITLRQKTQYNPSISCQLSPTGYVVRRTDFDGVRKHTTIVVTATEPPTVDRVSIALRAAWMALAAEMAS